jgi:two-component system, chemotaxis family, chemotaxis protein CheY
MKLLIVDDSFFIRDRIERAVKIKEIKQIYTATNGIQALEIFDFYKPELT